jgi:tRNA threonylcarbamoyladenosine modification (KEOPS) complex Cgi121 subunit
VGTPEDPLWIRPLGTEDLSMAFAAAFQLSEKTDLTTFAKTLPEGVVLCDTKIIAGISHIEAILLQTREYWRRKQKLVRNGSIEILMRLSGQGQISEALEVSGIKDSASVAFLGLANNEKDIENLLNKFRTNFPTALQNQSLLKLDRKKASFLKRIYKLPRSFTYELLVIALQERSVLLIFSK